MCDELEGTAAGRALLRIREVHAAHSRLASMASEAEEEAEAAREQPFDFKGSAPPSAVGRRMTVWYEEEGEGGAPVDVPYVGRVTALEGLRHVRGVHGYAGVCVKFEGWADDLLITNEDEWKWADDERSIVAGVQTRPALTQPATDERAAVDVVPLAEPEAASVLALAAAAATRRMEEGEQLANPEAEAEPDGGRAEVGDGHGDIATAMEA